MAIIWISKYQKTILLQICRLLFCQLLTERQNWYWGTWGTWGTKMLWTPPHVGGFQSSSIYIAQTNLDIQDQSIQSISISFQGVCKTAVKELAVSTTRTRKQQIPISELGQLTTKWEYWRQLWYPYGSLSVYPPRPPGYMHKREGIGVPRPSVSVHAVNFSLHNFDRSFENRTSRRSIRWGLLAGIGTAKAQAQNALCIVAAWPLSSMPCDPKKTVPGRIEFKEPPKYSTASPTPQPCQSDCGRSPESSKLVSIFSCPADRKISASSIPHQ